MKNLTEVVEQTLQKESNYHPIDPAKVFNSIVDVVFAIDEQGFFRFVTPSCIGLFGYTAEEMSGASFADFIHPDDIEKTVQIVSERSHDCTTSNFENRYIRKNGSVVSIIWSGRWDDNDKLLYCVARDGSEKHIIEQRLKKAQNWPK